jgi:CubicO group peptidase (beta-lactamase class C family)
MNRLSRCLLLAAAIIPLARAAAQLPPAQFTDPDRAAKLAAAFPAIDSILTAFALREHIPGAAWGIVVDGKLAHVSAAGLRDIATRAAVDTNSVFRIASMTKSFTAASILLLRDEGRLSLDDPAERWVPELKGLRPTTDSPVLTIRMLLSHDSGWPEDNPWGDQQLSIADSTLSRMIRGGIPFSHAPNTAYEYSNYAFMILGRIVAKASGMTYPKFVQTRLLTPLGMKSSTLEVGTVPKDKLALGYRWEDDTWKLEPQLPDGAGGPMGGMLTSPHDMGVWIANFLAAWPPRDGAETGPVRRASLREMQQMHRTRPPLVRYDTVSKNVTLFAPGYGFGLRIVADCKFSHIVAHAGGLPGFGSLMIWLPEYGVGIFAFGNRTYTDYSAMSDSAFAMMQRTGGLERRVPQPAPALVKAKDQVSRLVIKWSDALADSIASMNLYLDHSKSHRIARLDSLHAKVGSCSAAANWYIVENALRGQWIMPCEHGAIGVSITMAPTMPPSVQYFEVTEESAAMGNAVHHPQERNCRN